MQNYLLTFFTLLFAGAALTAGETAVAPAIGVAYFDGPTQNTFSTTNTQGGATTFTIDEVCQTILLQLTNPDPNGTNTDFESYTLRPRDASGSSVTDFTGLVNVSFRVRSAEEVTLTTQFNSGGATSDERTDRLSAVIPGDLSAWTEVTFTFDPANYGPSFVENDINRVSMWLDRGSNVFAGNEFYIDNIFFGGDIDAAFESPCSLDPGPDVPVSEHYLQDADHGGDPLLGNTSASGKSTLTMDANCEWLQISVSDPVGNPVTGGQPYSHRPRNASGSSIPDVTGEVRVVFSVWSAEETNFGVLFRDDEDDRTVRKEVIIPGGGTEWTTVDLSWTAAEYNGFDPDMMDIVWFYLDPGNNNFPGNNFFIDHIVVGGDADESKVSPCDLPPLTLPLEWAFFHGTASTKGDVALNWATSREENTSHFTVEYSQDGRRFAAVGRVLAAGNSSTQMNYSFEHDNQPAGEHYYRLRQDDIDGAFSYSDILPIEVAESTQALYPNPAENVLRFPISAPTPYELLDQSGRRLLSGVSTGAIEVSSLAPGQYIVRMNGAIHRFVKK